MLLSGAALFAIAPSANAQTVWTGGGVTDTWFDGANWTAGVPNSGVDANIGPAGHAEIGIGAAAVGNFNVGTSGSGASLNIFGGGDLLANGQSRIGYGLGSSASITVDGAGSTYSAPGGIWVGWEGTGSLTVQNDADVIAVLTSIGLLTTASGQVLVTGAGSNLQNSAALFVGELGAGVLRIENGGHVSAPDGYFGVAGNGAGEIFVAGTSSLLTINNVAYLGYNRPAEFTIANGGLVNIANLRVAEFGTSSGSIFIGGETTAAAAGTLNTSTVRFIAGTGLLAFNHTDTNYIFAPTLIGGTGSETLRATSGTTTLTANNAGFGGTLLVDGGATLVLRNNLTATSATIGDTGIGTLRVEGGADLVTTSTLVIGNSLGSDGDVVLTGAGTSWSTGANVVRVGNAGHGDLTVSSGASFNNGNTLFVGAGGTGTVTITDANSVLSTVNIGVAGSSEISVLSGAAAFSSNGTRRLTAQHGAIARILSSAIRLAVVILIS